MPERLPATLSLPKDIMLTVYLLPHTDRNALSCHATHVSVTSAKIYKTGGHSLSML